MLAWIVCALTVSFFLVPKFEVQKGTVQKRVITLVLANIVMLLPIFNGWPIVFYMVGWFGEFSVTLLLWSIARHVPMLGMPDRSAKIVLLLIGLWMIVSQVVAGVPDLYRFGLLPKNMMLVLLVVGTLAWYFQQRFLWLALWLVIPAWWWQLYDSQNLWDYLLDPILTIAILVSLIKEGIGYYRGKSKAVSG
jgi:hypothetical protein